MKNERRHTPYSRDSGFVQRPLTRDELQLGQYGYELLRPDTVMHYPFRDGASLTVFKNDVERTAATIALVSKQDAETFRRMAAARKTIAPGSADSPAKTRLQANFKALAGMTGFAAAREMWVSPYMRAAAVSGGKFNGPSAAELGTGMQAFSMLDHVAGRPIPKGGSGMLTVALGRLIGDNSGVVLTNMPVIRSARRSLSAIGCHHPTRPGRERQWRHRRRGAPSAWRRTPPPYRQPCAARPP